MGLIEREARRLYDYNGGKYSVQELAEMAGCSVVCMKGRLGKYMTPEEAVKRGPAKRDHLIYEYKGRLLSVNQLALIARCSYQAMAYRLRHYTPEVAVAMKQPEGVKRCIGEERFEYKGRMYTVNELAEIAGCTGKEMDVRLDFYHTVEAAVRGAASLSV